MLSARFTTRMRLLGDIYKIYVIENSNLEGSLQ